MRKRPIIDVVTHAVSKLAPRHERLLRDQAEREAILSRALQLNGEYGHRKALRLTMEQFRINDRLPKERAAYERFINAALTPAQKSRTKVTPGRKRGAYDADKPDPVAFQRDRDKRFP